MPKTDPVVRRCRVGRRRPKMGWLVALAVLGGGVTFAADMTDVDVARLLARADRADPVDLAGRDLSFLDLAGLDFKAARLERANLHAVDVAGADLSGAKLAGAHLDRATVQRTRFDGADLRGASLLRVSVTTELDLTMKAVADAPSFAGADLTGARIFARLNGANLRGADLTGARLGHYRLTVIELHPRTFLELADLSHARLRDADLVGVQLSWAKLVGADLTGAKLTNANLTGADLTGADLSGADLTGADLDMAILRDVKGFDRVVGLDHARNADRIRR